MAKFKYNARTQQGELQTGFVDAANREAALNILSGHNLFILSLEDTEEFGFLDRISKLFKRVKTNDLMIFTRQLATLMESKIPLGNSLRTLYAQTKNQILKETIFEISSDVDAGLSLSQAMERQGRVFSDFYLNMVRSAEVTGRLEDSMLFLADYLEKEITWKNRIRNALIYPAVVVVLFIIVAGIMLVVVFPQIEPIFADTGTQLPLVTQIFLTVGNFIIGWWWLIILLIGIFVFLILDYFQSDEGKAVFNELVIKLPIFGNLLKKIYVARFADSLGVLIKGGVPVTQAIEITGHAIGNIVYRDVLHEISESVRGGELLSSLLSKNEYYFPALVSQMTAVGENTGRLDEMMGKISIFYNREVNDMLSNLLELIQPVLIAVIGVFVGLLFASILIPIYNLAQSF